MKNSDDFTRAYFERILLEMRHIDSVKADTKTVIFGKEFSMPVTTAALSHLKDGGMVKMADGARMAGALCFSGMNEFDEIKAMCDTGADVIKIIKPHAKNEDVFKKIREAEEAGCFGIGMDIDHAFQSWSGEYDCVTGLDMKPKSLDEMKSFVQASKLPFVVKGVLSVSDALKAVEMGAKGIVVSHHHGIMDFAVPPVMILPEIKKAVGDKLTIFVDCDIESGMDVFKALALGADAVCVGRAVMDPIKEKGAEGCAGKLGEINAQLKGTMSRTGFGKVQDIDDSVIHMW